MKFAVVDTETTGLNSKKCAMIQLSILIVGEDGGIQDSNTWIMRPHEGAEIQEDALAVNGLTPTELANYPDPSEMAEDIGQWLLQYGDPENQLTMVGYNVSFDKGFISQFSKKFSVGDLINKIFHRRTLDVMSLAIAYMAANGLEPKKGKYSQINCATAMGIEIDKSKSHEAFYDASVCYLIFDKVSKLLNESQPD